MSYQEVLAIRPQCASCPMLERLEGIYELGEEMVAETSYSALYEKVRHDVFAQLLDDGASIEDAERVIAESVADLREIVAQMLSNSQENMQAVVGLGRKLMETCRSEGTLLAPGTPRVYVCMSKLAILAADNSTNSPRR